MPFKSESQRRKFYHLAKQGLIPQHVVEEWEKHTGDRKLPERSKPKKGRSSGPR